jgi:hypothetical protein
MAPSSGQTKESPRAALAPTRRPKRCDATAFRANDIPCLSVILSPSDTRYPAVGAVARQDLRPLENAAHSRRTPCSDICREVKVGDGRVLETLGGPATEVGR